MLSLAVIGSVAIFRATTLRGLPDIPEPFNRDDSIIAIPDAENAYTWYRRATEIFAGHELPSMSVFTDESVITDIERRSLEANRGALDVWLEGTRRDRAICFQPRDVTGITLLVVDQKLRNFAQLAHLRAFLLKSQGDFAGAWAWIKASLRASRHVGSNGFFMERMMGIGYYEWASKQAILWADDPKVDAKLLRQALDDVLAIDAMTPSGSSTVRMEYFSEMNTLDDWKQRESNRHGYGEFSDRPFGNQVKVRLDTAMALLAHEPERSRRVARLILSNWLAAADLPRSERSKRLMNVGKYQVFQAPHGSPATLSSTEMEGWINSSYYIKAYVEFWSGWNTQVSRDEVNRAKLIVHLAERLYLRERGKPPESPEQLVGPYLKALPEAY